ncbi:MAG: type II toxin-antitoxin system RelE/ParE family toxin [Rhizobiaceae bacterium]|nr:type II toxin-antitoxin system RelE/ParE family toxin [Rhizobiaceae bacterium]
MTAPKLEGYRLTPAAQTDLDDIWTYTVAQWSADQAESYLRGLAQTLDLLVGEPKLARERNEIAPPVRLHPYRSHSVIYRIEGRFIDVIRIVHSHQHWQDLIGA